MSDLAALLVAYRDATGCEAAIWERVEGEAAGLLIRSSSDAFAERTRGIVCEQDVEKAAETRGCLAWKLSVDSDGWLITTADDGTNEQTAALLTRAVPVVRRLARERDGATRELAERYEEINLLYAISELLGGDLPVEVSAGTLLRELAVTIGATSAAFLLIDSTQRRLEPIATLGLQGRKYPTIPISDENYLAARVFRAGTAISEVGSTTVITDPILGVAGGAVLGAAITRASTLGDLFSDDEAVDALYRTRETPIDNMPLGVVLLAREDVNAPFTAGDRKLVIAVTAQLGTALHNAALMRAAVEREHFAREMRLAHDLQLKLLPNPRVVGPEARAAARVIPAESVGGDFFLLARIDAQRTGVLIGDVSGHGYQAALVMALALSAAAIHVRAAADPAETLNAVSQSLREELESTEMSLSLCYVIIDDAAGLVRYANAGHPHVFHQHCDGALTRLAAHALPLGFVEETIGGSTVAWSSGDRIICFTDGIVDVRNEHGERLGEDAVLEVIRSVQGALSPDEVLDKIAERVQAFRGETTLEDDLTIVVVDRKRTQ